MLLVCILKCYHTSMLPMANRLLNAGPSLSDEEQACNSTRQRSQARLHSGPAVRTLQAEHHYTAGTHANAGHEMSM